MYWSWDFSRNAAHTRLLNWKAGALLMLASMLAVMLPAGVVFAASFSIATGQQVILDMGTPDRFRTNFDSTTQAVASVSNGDCTLQTVPETLMMVRPSSGAVGFKAGPKNDWLGLNAGGSSGIPCARVFAPGQWLEFELANDSGVLDGRTFVQVDMAFNLKKDAAIRVQIFLGTTQTAEYYLYSGSSIPVLISDPVHQLICAPGSDSGNDSQSVNCRQTFHGEGDKIRLTATDGEFSVGGRSSQSVWHLSRTFVETGVLDCGETTQQAVGGVDQFGNDFSDVSMVCHRLPNLEALNPSPGQCEDIQYNLQLTCEGAAGDYDPLSACAYSLYYATEPLDPGNYQKFQFVCELYTPAFEATITDGTYVPPTIEQYFGPSDSQGDDQELCAGTTPTFKAGMGPTYEIGGNIPVNGMPALEEYESFDAPAALDHCPSGTCGVPGQQLGCTIDRRHFQVEDPISDGVVETWVVEFVRWYLRGDYKALLTR